MTLQLLSGLLTALAAVLTLLAFGRRLRAFNTLARPADRSRPKGQPAAGVLYAFTWGMMPWAKESTRRHWRAYLRGILFHLTIFLGLGLLVASPWFGRFSENTRQALAVATGVGALLGLTGFVARLIEPNLRALSIPDDYFSVLLVSLFLAAASVSLLWLEWLPLLYLVSAALLVYAPLGKIRHCIYYAYSRLFFGKFIGRRAVLPHNQQRRLPR